MAAQSRKGWASLWWIMPRKSLIWVSVDCRDRNVPGALGDEEKAKKRVNEWTKSTRTEEWEALHIVNSMEHKQPITTKINLLGEVPFV